MRPTTRASKRPLGPAQRADILTGARTLLTGAAALFVLSALPGNASPAPLEAQPQRDRGRTFNGLKRQLDKNLDGKISEAEWTRPKRAFKRLDKNRDGFLTLEDFAEPASPAPKSTSAGDPVDAPVTMDREALLFFESKIRPVLAESCYSCHSASSPKLRAGLRVDSRAHLLAGGVGGPALIPGDVDASMLIEAVRYDDPLFAMPPKKKLSDEAISNLERWVRMGAPWPSEPALESSPGTPDADSPTGNGLNRDIDIKAGREFWSFRPLTTVTPPTPKDASWSLGPIDQFLRAAMEERGVEPVGDANDATWLRRVTFDLTGLPPTPEEIAAFESDRRPDRLETVVDRLLASRAYGERFGRHWLDVARYGESSGKQTNVVYPQAWRYRDWVIDAIEADLPYDQFLKAQIAGDLLPADDADQRASNLIATGYLALGSKAHNTRDARQFKLDMVDEQIDAVSQGMLGLTISCARCHDHKFDPIPTEDYYSLAGIFMSSETQFGTQRASGNNQASSLIELPKDANVPNGPTMDARVRTLLERARGRSMAGSGDEMMGDKMAEAMTEAEKRDAARRARVREAQAKVVDSVLARFDDRGRALPSNRMAMGMAEGEPIDLAILERGELDRPSGVAKRGMPQVLTPLGGNKVSSGSGRRELAEWISSPENPLTARVWVNRVWHHMFGNGIVRTPDHFGAGGAAPDHPELLDWLSAEFIGGGWSTKSLVRSIALSHAYRLDSKNSVSGQKRDPDFVTLWRMPERRLEAEAIRDAMLSASGTLAAEAPTGSPSGTMEGTLRRTEVATFLTREAPVRSIYLAQLRGFTPDSIEAFDAPDPAFVTGAREITTVATQALFLMNDEMVLAQSDAFAMRILKIKGGETKRIEAAFKLAYGRQPSSSEVRIVRAFLKDYAKAESVRAAWSAFAQSLFQSAEFRALG